MRKSDRPAVGCGVAQFEKDEDSSQGHGYWKCNVCGAARNSACRLSEDLIITKVSTEAMMNIPNAARIANAKALVAELILAEREKTGHTVDEEVHKRLQGHFFRKGMWETLINIAAFSFVIELVVKFFFK